MGKSIKTSHLLLLAAGLAVCVQPVQAQFSSELDVLLQTPAKKPYLWFASTDPKSQNNDYIMLKPGERRRIPLAEGTLERLWSTSLFPDQIDLFLEPGPRQTLKLLSGGVADMGLISGKAYTLFPALKYESARRLKKGAALVAVNRAKEPSKWYYQATVRPAAAGTLPLPPKAREISYTRFPAVTLEPGEEKSIQAWETPGQIYEFEVAVDGSPGDTFKNLRLRAAWEDKVAVDAPLLALAGQIKGDGLVQNAVSNFDSMALKLYWPMPFEKGEIWLRNTGDKPVKLQASARIRKYDAAPTPYRFCAVEQSAKTEKGKPVEILNVTGEGAFAGLALDIKPGPDAASRTFAYLEGNETLVADGQTYEGTGNEDYFSSAWYYPEQPFYHPYEGLTYKTASPPEVSTYRLMVHDAVPFKKTFNFTFEHGNKNNRNDLEWQWVAFWYQNAPLSIPNSVSAASPSSSAPRSGGSGPNSNLPLWIVPVGGVAVGVLLYLSKRKGREAARKAKGK